jgi:hypothetical protein
VSPHRAEIWLGQLLSSLGREIVLGTPAWPMVALVDTRAKRRRRLRALAIRTDDPYCPSRNYLATNTISQKRGDEWDGNGNVIFSAVALRSGEKLTVYLDYQLGPASPTGGGFVLPGQTMPDARVEIGSIDHFSHDQRIRITLATVTDFEGHQQIFQWGDASYNNTKVGVTWGSYIGRIVLVSQDKSEEYYYFIVIPRSFDGDPRPPIIVGPDLMDVASKWDAYGSAGILRNNER